jgi:hypothetical protein
MKKMLFVLLLFATIANAQNWSPVATGNKYHYTCDTTQTIFTLFADSFDVQGSDTLFYMNRIVLPCDTCTNLSGYQSCGIVERIFLKNQPQFLMRNCFVSDTAIWAYSNGSFALYPKLTVGSNWIFDTLNNVTATITEKATGNVLGYNDSICVMILSTGDSLVLSKNFGVVIFPVFGGGYFRLYGIEGNISIGERLAGFKDFFNFNVGDYFVYRTIEYSSEPPMDYSHLKRWHYEITAKTNYADGFGYTFEGYSCTDVWACINPVPLTTTVCYRDTAGCTGYVESNSFSDTRKFLNSYSYSFIESEIDNFGQPYLYSMEWYKINDTTYCRSKAYAMCYLYPSSPNFHPDVLVSYYTNLLPPEDCMWGNDGFPCNQFTAREGVGLIFNQFTFFEHGRLAEILVAVVNNVTYYNMLVGSGEIEDLMLLPEVFPNPASKNITLTNGLLYFSATIYSTSGKKVKELILSGDQTEVDVSFLNPGMYFVILEGKGRRATLKFVVE